MSWLLAVRDLSYAHRVAIVIAAGLAVVVLTLSVPPFPQSESFHNFADGRALFDIPNVADVTSNLAFLFAGLTGLIVLVRLPPRVNIARLPYYVFALALIAVTLGSGYYHWEPTTTRLYWDRLAMTAAFMSLSAAIISDRLDRRAGLILLPVLLVAGAAAATHWRQSELAGAGDLRVYFLVQFVPALCLPLMVLLFSDDLRYERYLLLMLGLYAAAMLLEQGDALVFRALGGTVGGHTLKHLTAALGGYMPFHRLSVASR